MNKRLNKIKIENQDYKIQLNKFQIMNKEDNIMKKMYEELKENYKQKLSKFFSSFKSISKLNIQVSSFDQILSLIKTKFEFLNKLIIEKEESERNQQILINEIIFLKGQMKKLPNKENTNPDIMSNVNCKNRIELIFSAGYFVNIPSIKRMKELVIQHCNETEIIFRSLKNNDSFKDFLENQNQMQKEIHLTPIPLHSQSPQISNDDFSILYHTVSELDDNEKNDLPPISENKIMFNEENQIS